MDKSNKDKTLLDAIKSNRKYHHFPDHIICPPDTFISWLIHLGISRERAEEIVAAIPEEQESDG